MEKDAEDVDDGGGQEDGEEDEEDERGKDEDREGRLTERGLPGLAGAGVDLASSLVSGRVMLRQRLCWLGEQFRQSLFERTQIQNLQAPLLLQPQHFGGMVKNGVTLRLYSACTLLVRPGKA